MGEAGLLTAHAAPGAAVNPLAPKKPHFPAKAKSVIFLFMYGGPSHIDTFDYKPTMVGMDNKTIAVKTFGRGGHKNQGRVVGPKWQFKPYGQCGKMVSDLFPHVGGVVDEFCFLHTVRGDSGGHSAATLGMLTAEQLVVPAEGFEQVLEGVVQYSWAFGWALVLVAIALMLLGWEEDVTTDPDRDE